MAATLTKLVMAQEIARVEYGLPWTPDPGCPWIKRKMRMPKADLSAEYHMAVVADIARTRDPICAGKKVLAAAGVMPS